MPSIPFIQSDRSIPGTSGGVYAPSEDPVSAAIVRGGALMAKEADQFMGVLTAQKHWEDAQARAEQNAQRHMEALTFGHDLKNDVDTIAESYKGRTDYQKFEEDGQKALDALKAKYDGAITDPVVKRVFMPTFLQESYNLQKTIRDKKNEVLTEAGKGQWIIERDQALKNWVNAVTPEEKQAVADEFELTTQALVVGRILKPAEAETGILTFKNDANIAYVLELKRSDPGRALIELSDNTKLLALDPVKRQQEIASTVRAIEQRDRKIEQEQKGIQEEAEQQIMDALDKKDITGASVMLEDFGLQRLLSPEKRRVLKSAIEDARKVDKSDPEVFNTLETKVLIGEAGQSEILKARGVSTPDKNKLLRLLKDEKDPRKSYDYTEAMKSAHAEIVTTGPLAALDPDQQSRFTSYKRGMEKFVQAGGDPWKFYDANIWKYRPSIPATNYGTPKTFKDVTTMRDRLREDVKNGKIKTPTAKIEAAKLEAAMDYIMKRDQVRKNAGKPQ